MGASTNLLAEALLLCNATAERSPRRIAGAVQPWRWRSIAMAMAALCHRPTAGGHVPCGRWSCAPWPVVVCPAAVGRWAGYANGAPKRRGNDGTATLGRGHYAFCLAAGGMEGEMLPPRGGGDGVEIIRDFITQKTR